MARHVRKGDTVMVNSGTWKGQVGEVLRVDPKHDSVIVRGINVRTKHVKPSQAAPQGGIITKEMPIHISKVNPVVDGKPVRVGVKVDEKGNKVRVARRAGAEVKVLGVLRKAGV